MSQNDKSPAGGGLERAIDFEKLKQMLADHVREGEEAYEFTWVGKKAAIVEANRPIRKTLRPCVEESKDWDTTQNLYIEGDNLEALKLLQESYLGKVKMIYIDPPYNTGNDFIYNDDFKQSFAEYEEDSGVVDEDGNRMKVNHGTDGRFHSKWCSMIYSRLVRARDLLTEDGVIFISIDYNENFNLRKIADEIFGDAHFIGEIYWESKTKSQNTATSYNKLQPKEEMILVYSMDTKRKFNLIKIGEKEYPETDAKGNYREYPIEVMNANGVRGRESMIFPIKVEGVTITPPDGKQWQIGIDKVAQYKEKGDIFIRDGKAIVKMRPEDEKGDKTQPFWGMFSKEIGTAESAKAALKILVPKNGFDTVKPVELIKRLIYHGTDKNDIIVDFFSGSATTAHATMELNAEDGGDRKFILVQFPELYDEQGEAYKAGFRTICDVGKERIRKAAEELMKQHPQAKIDAGFRVLKVDSSNMNDVYYGAEELTQDLVAQTEDNIKSDRTSLDLLFGCLVDWGVPLSLPYTSKTIDGCTVHDYADGALIACFDRDVPESVIRAIAKRQPERAVFRDSSFADSPAKINVTEIFKRLSPDTDVRVL